MSAKAYRMAGSVCLVLCAVSVIVGMYWYATHSTAVHIVNDLRETQPEAPAAPVEPTTPALTKASLALAVLFAIAGVTLLLVPVARESEPLQVPTNVP